LFRGRSKDVRCMGHGPWPLPTRPTLVLVDFARVMKRRIPEKHRATHAWFEQVKARPSAQA